MEETKKPAVVTPDDGYDASEVNTKEVGVFIGIIVAIIVGVFLFVTFFYDRFYNMLYKERVEEAATVQLDTIHAREKAALTGYSAYDPAKGTYRIPIDRAKQLLLEEVAAGKTPYPTKDQAVKAEPGAAPGAPGAAPAAPGAAPANAAPASAPPASK